MSGLEEFGKGKTRKPNVDATITLTVTQGMRMVFSYQTRIQIIPQIDKVNGRLFVFTCVSQAGLPNVIDVSYQVTKITSYYLKCVHIS